MRRALAPLGGPFLVKGSPGRGTHWAAVPWLAVFDPAVTTSATRGHYLVYLFPAHREAVHLSLVQGTMAAMQAHGPGAVAHLRASGDKLRVRMADFADRFPNTEIALGSVGALPEGYEAAHILGLSYALAELADERRLHRDLAHGIEAYRALTARGGLALPDADRAGRARGSLGHDADRSSPAAGIGSAGPE